MMAKVRADFASAIAAELPVRGQQGVFVRVHENRGGGHGIVDWYAEDSQNRATQLELGPRRIQIHGHTAAGAGIR